MAKTRIKNTPIRLQKDVVVATTDDGSKKQRIGYDSPNKPQPREVVSTIIIAPPKRKNSICSVASSTSHASDTQSAHSDIESPPPPQAAVTVQSKTMLKNLLGKDGIHNQNVGALRNRKVYMITEKCENSKSESLNASAKRKMYLIMEESGLQNGGANATGAYNTEGEGMARHIDDGNVWKSENGKKLTLFADKSDGELTQRFEKILPEILNRIQAKNVMAEAKHQPAQHQLEPQNIHKTENVSANQKPLDDQSTRRTPITLPPKKNRSNIIATPHTSNIISNPNSRPCHHNNNRSEFLNGNNYNPQPSSAATPVIVSAASLMSRNSSDASLDTNANDPKQNELPAEDVAEWMPQKSINLSTDFLFLMKMLPKLEGIPEPQKSHVKHSIDMIMAQHANFYEK